MSKRVSFSDQIRKAIDESGMSRYEICKRLELDQGAMSRFMHGKQGLELATIDRLAEMLGLEITSKKGKRP